MRKTLRLCIGGMLLLWSALGVTSLLAQSPTDNVLATPITLSMEAQPLADILSQIEADYPVRFYYREEWLGSDPLSVNASNQPLGEVLDRLMLGTLLGYVTYGDYAVVLARKSALNRLDAFSATDYLSAVKDLDDTPEQGNNRVERAFVGDSSLRPRPAQATLRGVFYERESEAPIAAASLSVKALQTGAITDARGRYELTLPTGTHTITAEATGHAPRTWTLTVFSDASWDIDLAYSAYELDEVLLEANNDGQSLESTQAGKVELSIQRIRQMPPLLGEVDVVNAIKLLPGVSTVGEGSSGFNVRGGNIDQNLILQDGGLIFNASHLLGFFSIFNPDLVEKVTLYKGHIPARYGGRVSSVLDVDLMDGSFRTLRGRGSLGLFSSRLALNGPIVNGKTSFAIAVRGAYPNLLTQYVERIPEVSRSSFYYGDVTGKVTHKLGENGTLAATGYASVDFFRFIEEFGFEWQNRNLGLEWKQLWGNRFSTDVKVTGGTYRSDFFNANGVSGTSFETGIDHFRGQAHAQYVISGHDLQAGVDATSYNILPNYVAPFGEGSAVLEDTALKDRGLEMGLYVSDEFNINNYLRLYAGVRVSAFRNLGPFDVLQYDPNASRSLANVTDTVAYGSGDLIQQFTGFEPRISLRIRLTESASLKASYNRAFQYIHQLTNTASSTPVDVWQVSNSYFPAQRADNYSLGIFKNWGGKVWRTSLEGFYRELEGLVVPKDFATLLGNPFVETEVLSARGMAYGAEMSINRVWDKWEVGFAATYARTFRQAEIDPEGRSVNGGTWFPADFDMPLNLNINVRWKPRPNRTFSANFVYRSGRPITVPGGAYSLYPSWNVPFFTNRNEFRIPDYHRLDLAYTFDDGLVTRNAVKTDITFSVYNVYARQNPFSVFFQRQGQRYQAFQLSLLGTLLPFVSYNFSF